MHNKLYKNYVFFYMHIYNYTLLMKNVFKFYRTNYQNINYYYYRIIKMDIDHLDEHRWPRYKPRSNHHATEKVRLIMRASIINTP